jgi:uncharacterized membrane protein YgcG
MLISKALLLLLLASSLALIPPALAQEQAAAFEYSAVARLMRSGHFQAEVWRHDVRTDQSDLAWSNRELYPSAAAAMIEACTSLRKNFDLDFSCSHAAPQAVARNGAPANSSATASATKSAVPTVDRKVVVKEQITLRARGAWLTDFWKVQEGQSGGSAAGGGSGGGGGGGGGGSSGGGY